MRYEVKPEGASVNGRLFYDVTKETADACRMVCRWIGKEICMAAARRALGLLTPPANT